MFGLCAPGNSLQAAPAGYGHRAAAACCLCQSAVATCRQALRRASCYHYADITAPCLRYVARVMHIDSGTPLPPDQNCGCRSVHAAIAERSGSCGMSEGLNRLYRRVSAC